MGAGVIPVARHDGQVSFLFQKVFSGRKVGTLVDFGGGLGAGESYSRTAAREFVEETETMYFADDVSTARRTDTAVARQVRQVEELFAMTLREHPDWWCRRATIDPKRPKDWRTFFVRFPHREVEVFNREWLGDTSGRFKKRRELIWVPALELLEIYDKAPERLWKRVRQLEGAALLVAEIERCLLAAPR